HYCLTIRPPPRPTLFPYTTLFRSSQISTNLAHLKRAGLVEDRRMGKNAFYRLTAPAGVMDLLRQAENEIPEAARDREALRLALRSEEHTSELQSPCNLVCRLLLEK